jgi:dephospho-CoA kinase
MNETIKMVLKIAITGGAGSGKTSVCNRFIELGIKVLNSDTLARKAVTTGSPAYEKIVNHFGREVLLSNGTLNRQMLRNIIIKDDNARIALEKITHPEITKLMNQKIAQAEKDGDDIVLVEVPLLFELGMENHFDLVIVVSADHKLRVKRLMDRDDISHDEAKDLINVQMPEEEKVKRTEFVIINDNTKEQLIKSVDLLHKKIIKNFHKKIETT